MSTVVMVSSLDVFIAYCGFQAFGLVKSTEVHMAVLVQSLKGFHKIKSYIQVRDGIMEDYYMAVSHKYWELPNSRI